LLVWLVDLRYGRPVADFQQVIGDREPLAWILTQGRMAFPAHRVRETGGLSVGDRLFLYTTRGCFRQPHHHRGRVIGEAVVKSAASSLDEPVKFGDASFPLGCDLEITGLVPRGEGPDIAALVENLHMFPNPRGWMTRLRRVLVALDSHDAALLHRKLAPEMQPVGEHRDGYLVRTRFAGFAGG
jgi:hypothetical protein